MTRYLTRTTTALALGAIAATAAAAEGELYIYHWFEYMPQELIDKFEAETGIDLVMDTFDSNEAMLASLRAGGMGTYDVAVPGDYMVQIMRDSGMLDSFDPTEVPNHANIAPEWLDVSFDPGRMHSIPYQWGSTSFSVNREVFDGEIDTTSIIFEPPEELAGTINVLDSQGEVMALASMHLGIPQCTTDRAQLEALDGLLQSAKEGWASINSDTSKDVLVSGDAAVGMIWGGFGAKAREEGAPVEYAWPEQGYVVWMDNVVLLDQAPNRDNAIIFLNFMLEPENSAMVSNFARYSSGVMGTEPFLDPSLATMDENNPPPGLPTTFVEVCNEETQALYDRIWTRVKR